MCEAKNTAVEAGINPKTGIAAENAAASRIRESFEAYSADFTAISARAKSRFEKREWNGVLEDAAERLGLYHQHLNAIEAVLSVLMAKRLFDYLSWETIKREYLNFYREAYNADLALVYFYSVMRRIFLRRRTSIEYSDDEIRRCIKAKVAQDTDRPVRVYPADSANDIAAGLVKQIVADFGFGALFHDLDQDADLAAAMFRPEVEAALRGHPIDRVEFLEAAFFRNKAAYLMGRIVAGKAVVPMVLVLLHPEEGIVIDSALSEERDLSNVFTSARSNFHTDTTAYREVFEFLESIAPTRPKTYIYTAMGFIHPGKLQLVHELRQHLAQAGERFSVAKGVPGTVMEVFALPSFRYVFKVIRDTSTKETFRGHQHVIGQYWRVHRMDRVGRMLDVMTFHNLRFRRSDFEEKLLEELLREAPSSVREEDSQIVFRHLYAARQIIPLDVFLADPARSLDEKNSATIEYGHAIKDLAAAGTFVGDYLPKNFGVSQLGRVILYDYDDLDDLVRYNFRKLPEPPRWAETLPFEDWISKGEFDVFPEYDFRIFTVPARTGEVFLQYHADIIDPEFWNSMKKELLTGNVPEFFPYSQRKRLANRLIAKMPASGRQVHAG
jgi:isocitrate dehydrogenase kinase/phosphatase